MDTWLRRRRLLWLALTIVVLLLAAASPVLWAGYHAYAGHHAWQHYHSAEAQRHFTVCLDVWPWSRNSRLHLLAAQAARRAGDFEVARQLLLKCQVSLHNNSEEVLLEWSMLRATMGDLDATEGPLREIVRAQPSMLPVVYEALAEGYLVMARIRDAIRATDDWLAREPNNPQAWFVRGKIHRQVGSMQAVVADYRRVLELDPERTQARWRLALALLDIGRYQEADQLLQIFGRSHSQDVEVQVRRAVCLWRLEREAEAESLLDNVLAEHPHHGLALLTRGQIFLMAFQCAKAEPWLRQAADILPYDHAAQNALWQCLRQQGKTEEAEAQHEVTETLYERGTQLAELLNHRMQQSPNDPALHYQVGTLYLQLGFPQTGEAWLHSALRHSENYVPALEALAKLSHEHGDKEREEEYHQRAQIAKSRHALKSHE
ncbi:MAG TPA: tetratricopeptide repeat protein [Gemmataceae bacterium]